MVCSAWGGGKERKVAGTSAGPERRVFATSGTEGKTLLHEGGGACSLYAGKGAMLRVASSPLQEGELLEWGGRKRDF